MRGRLWSTSIYALPATHYALRLRGAKRDLPAVIPLRPGARLEQERAVLGDAARAPDEPPAAGQDERHAPVLVSVAPLPFGAQRLKAVARESLQRAVELDQDDREEHVAVGRSAACLLEIGGGLRDARARR